MFDACFICCLRQQYIEKECIPKGTYDIDIDALKIFLLLYADDIVIPPAFMPRGI